MHAPPVESHINNPFPYKKSKKKKNESPPNLLLVSHQLHKLHLTPRASEAYLRGYVIKRRWRGAEADVSQCRD